MKYAAIILTMLFVSPISFAKKKFAVPQDAVIKVYSKEGKLLGTMSRKHYKVVRLGTSKVRIVEKVEYVERKAKRTVGLVIGGAFGRDGLDVRTDGDHYTVEEGKATVGTFGVCTFKKGAGVCGTVGTDQSVGVQFHIPISK